MDCDAASIHHQWAANDRQWMGPGTLLNLIINIAVCGGHSFFFTIASEDYDQATQNLSPILAIQFYFSNPVRSSSALG